VPTIVKCAGCGALLAEFSEIPMNAVAGRGNMKTWIQKLQTELHGHCPSCGHQLSNEIVDCDVKLVSKTLGDTSS